MSRILGSLAPTILAAVFQKAWQDQTGRPWSKDSGMVLKEMLKNPLKLDQRQKEKVVDGNLHAFDVSLFALVLVHDPGSRRLIEKHRQVVKATRELAQLRNNWSHDRQQSQILTEVEFDELWKQADKNLNVLACWAGSEAMELLQCKMKEISRESVGVQEQLPLSRIHSLICRRVAEHPEELNKRMADLERTLKELEGLKRERGPEVDSRAKRKKSAGFASGEDGACARENLTFPAGAELKETRQLLRTRSRTRSICTHQADAQQLPQSEAVCVHTHKHTHTHTHTHTYTH